MIIVFLFSSHYYILKINYLFKPSKRIYLNNSICLSYIYPNALKYFYTWPFDVQCGLYLLCFFNRPLMMCMMVFIILYKYKYISPFSIRSKPQPTSVRPQ